MYTKEDVLKISQEFFMTKGYEIKALEGMVVVKDNITYPIIALGSVNDAASTSIRGKGFNKNQIKTLLGLCLFEIISKNTACKLIIPDTKVYRKQFGFIKEGLSRLLVETYYISEVGIMTLV